MKTIKVIESILLVFTLVTAFHLPGFADELIVTETGNVGIGTTTPSTKLSLGTPVQSRELSLHDSTSDWYGFGIQSYQLRLQVGNTNARFSFLAGDSNEVMTIKGNGNVGIGTSNPRVTVDVPNNLDVQGGLYLGRTGAYNGTINTDDSLFINIDANNDQVNSRFQIGTNSPNSTGGATPLLTVIDNGNVGIGTTTPQRKLEVTGSAKISDKIGTFGFDPNSGYPYLWGGGVHTWDVYAEGSVGVGTSGSLTAYMSRDGAISAVRYNTTSDARYKEDIKTLDGSLEKISLLRGVTYNWADKSRGKDRQVGVIAQEVEQVFPELVSTNEQGFKSVEYSKLVAPLIEAVKELKAQNDQLASENQSLKSSLNDIMARLDALEKK